MTLPSADDLWRLFRADEMNERELATILMNQFNSAMPAAPSGVVYPADNRFALKVSYKGDVLVHIDPGERLTEEVVSKIRAEIDQLLAGPEAFRVRRWILLDDYLPVRGYWRYRDRFQILPAPTHAPQPPLYHSVERPLVLESKYRDAHDVLIRTDRSMVAAKEIALLLNVLLDTRVRLVDGTNRHHWVMVNPNGPPPVRVECLREWYAIEEFKNENEHNDMSPTSGIAQLVEVPHDEYYSRWNLGKGNREMEVPASLTTMFDRFYAASEVERRRCLRFCFWVRQAHEERNYSATASYISLVHGIEALVPDAGPRIECPRCKQNTAPGPTRRFKEFVDKYAPNSNDEEGRTGLYKIRSGIAHGGPVLWTDRQPGFDHIMMPGWSEQLGWLNEAWQVAQGVFVNYLLALPPSS